MLLFSCLPRVRLLNTSRHNRAELPRLSVKFTASASRELKPEATGCSRRGLAHLIGCRSCGHSTGNEFLQIVSSEMINLTWEAGMVCVCAWLWTSQSPF
jgi:hypothetical protein